MFYDSIFNYDHKIDTNIDIVFHWVSPLTDIDNIIILLCHPKDLYLFINIIYD